MFNEILLIAKNYFVRVQTICYFKKIHLPNKTSKRCLRMPKQRWPKPTPHKSKARSKVCTASPALL